MARIASRPTEPHYLINSCLAEMRYSIVTPARKRFFSGELSTIMPGQNQRTGCWGKLLTNTASTLSGYNVPRGFDSLMDTNIRIDTLTGLSEAEATLRLQQHGYNELPSSKSHSILATAWDVVREPMFLLLLACGTIYLTLGDVQEAVMLLGFVFVVLGITLYQERKTERALEALRDLSSPRALVIRGGERKRIAGREVVPDDLVVLAEGDRVPADSVVLSCTNLATDESLLTGESVPSERLPGTGCER